MTVAPATAATPRSAIYAGRVMHHRLRPFRQRFTYRVWTLFVALDELAELDRRLRLMSVQRPNLISLYAQDHGARDGSRLEPWVRAELTTRGIDPGDGRIFMLAFPRLLGFVFNPLTVYFAYDRDQQLVALLYEVKNTFGGQHVYGFRVDGAEGRLAHGCAKDFYVSPFIPMDAAYAFNVLPPGDRISVVINERAEGEPQLIASLTADRRELQDANLARALLAHGLLTARVVAGIHVQALKLWWRGAKFHAPSSYPRPVVAGNTAKRGNDDR
ncbi:MAG: DUF1365 domain-containing protein [Pseudomonadota bacterium]